MKSTASMSRHARSFSLCGVALLCCAAAQAQPSGPAAKAPSPVAAPAARAASAPAPGSGSSSSDDVITDGRIITGENPDSAARKPVGKKAPAQRP